ncbi:MAG: DUF4262 domain-containing protein [Pedobacter sp.]|nr:MAG: DUF4262 domain-containing protein [Pedobacter sp.]
MDDQFKIDEERKVILSDIEEFGCHLIAVDPDNYTPGFVYSIGLYHKYGHPEIICFGLNSEVTASIINHACHLIQNGEPPLPNQPYRGYLEGYHIQFLEVDKAFYRNYLGYAGRFYDMGFDFPALQLVWPDKQDLFPWEEHFNFDLKFKQPLLDRNANFKFYEEKDLAVYTTKQILEGDPILYVHHNEDGDWQFYSYLDPTLDDIKVVSLQEMLEIDPSLNEIYYLQYGWRAWRSSRYDDWQDERFKDESIEEPILKVNVSDLVKDINKINLNDITTEWEWLIAGYKKVLMLTKFGDMFLQNPNDEVVWLDTGTGVVTEVASSIAEFEEQLNKDEKMEEWLLPNLFIKLQSLNINLKESQIYGFQVLPILGGTYTVENIKPIDIGVHFSINGEILRQLKNMPDGTEVQLKVSNPKKKPRWKFW